MKRFNTTGTCFPDKHYMVDISERVAQIGEMIDRGDYFCINRGRQYGKTTTLSILKDYLESHGYTAISISFELLGEESFASESSLSYWFVWLINRSIIRNKVKGLDPQLVEEISSLVKSRQSLPLPECSDFILNLCEKNSRGIVLMIDEVDQASNYASFIKFLGMLRAMYLDREAYPTFQSVILAGVYDIKNLKLKMRPDDEHQYNSPWNIAVPFDVDMSLHADGIAGMLAEYKADHGLDFDENLVAQQVYDYTSGYPFLVSRLCQIIDSKQYPWNRDGVVSAVHDILNEENTLFDDMVKKMDDFPELRKLMRALLYTGQRKNVSLDEKYIQLGLRFCFLKNDNGVVRIANRILETRLYNLFTVEDQNDAIFTQGSIDKNQFISGGMLNMRLILERFTEHYNDIYGSQPDAFKEKEGRRLFLLYLRPIINGAGNYYIEAETRDESRTDIVIDYQSHQYVIELKIWRGNAYNERGEQQLSEYLDYFHLETGYMVSFCFNKNKQSGTKEVTVGSRTIFETVV